MEYPKVNTGDSITITAEQWNGLMSLLAQQRSAGPGQTTNRKPTVAPAGDLVSFRNDTGSPIVRNHIVALGEPLTLPDADDDGTGNDALTGEYLRATVHKGLMPSAGYSGRWGVSIDSVPTGAFGRAMVIGIVQCRIDLKKVTDRYVDCGTTTVGVSGTAGAGTIVWVDGGVGTASQTGEQWATIKLGGGAAQGFIPVKLVQDGGSDGNGASGTAATWRYTITDLSNNKLAVNVPLFAQRTIKMETVPGKIGTVVEHGALAASIGDNGHALDEDGEPVTDAAQPYVLWSADEQFGAIECAEPSGSSEDADSGGQ